MFYIRHTSQNHRLECRDPLCVPADIAVAQLPQKIQKNLIIRSTVHFIDHQNNLFFRFITPVQKGIKQLIQFCFILFPGKKIFQLISDTFRYRKTVTIFSFQFTTERFYK